MNTIRNYVFSLIKFVLILTGTVAFLYLCQLADKAMGIS
jgi:hypothetical protein